MCKDCHRVWVKLLKLAGKKRSRRLWSDSLSLAHKKNDTVMVNNWRPKIKRKMGHPSFRVLEGGIGMQSRVKMKRVDRLRKVIIRDYSGDCGAFLAKRRRPYGPERGLRFPPLFSKGGGGSFRAFKKRILPRSTSRILGLHDGRLCF